MSSTNKERMPEWLRKSIYSSEIRELKVKLRDLKLNTVCESAKCPNISECFSKNTATFMIMGNTCTRNCSFCSVESGTPQVVDVKEPKNIVDMVKQLNLKHVVITSVTRDDLPDQGAGHFKNVVTELRQYNKDLVIEVLTPDFSENKKLLNIIIDSKPNIFNHNVEMVKELQTKLRSKSNYQRSLNVLSYVKEHSDIIVKSGFMVGLGESFEQILNLIDEIYETGTDILTIGQYLRPGIANTPVIKYYTPKEFEELKMYAIRRGFNHVFSSPLVRSSYMADDLFQNFRG
jgi:lipoic acid synthetase